MAKNVTCSSKRLTSTERRKALLQAAEEVFTEHGFIDASLDAIVKIAGGSKRNIYTEFGSKEGLFLALIDESATRVAAVASVLDKDSTDLRGSLAQFAEGFLDIVFSRSTLGLVRVMQMDGVRFPDIINTFFAVGPDRSLGLLSELLEKAKQRGEVSFEDSRLAASLFIGMLRGNILYLQAILKVESPPDKAELTALKNAAVDIFLDGIRTR